MWCHERRPAIGADVTNALRDLQPGDAKGDFDTAPIDHPRLGLHLAKALEIADGGCTWATACSAPLSHHHSLCPTSLAGMQSARSG